MAKKKEATKKATTKKVEILAHNCAGKYLLPYSKGAKVTLEAKQADELIAAKDAKEIK
jgi:hypothetical protein